MNRITALVIFLFTTFIYFLTVAPTVSYWDCGEFIASSFKMAVPHPPGSPLYLLVGRVFTLLPLGSDIGFRVNIISVFSSSITVMLLYLSIVHLVREWKGKLETKSDWLTAIFSGVLGSLSFAFTHSFWFNGSEAEVYAASMLFTSLIVWLILVWAEKSDEPDNGRYLLMIAYIIGLAIAVHLLNVLALPFVAMIYYYKRYDFNIKSFLIMMAITVVLILAVYPGMVKYVPLIALNYGVIGLVAFVVFIIGGTIWALNNKKNLLSYAFLSILLISIGYSTYATIYIRSNLDPMIDENDPENIENFIKYINREQYGDHSITDREAVWKSSPNGRNYTSSGDFFWRYQVDKMYVRYFLWQFVGMSENGMDWSAKQFFALPFLLGLIGIYWHFRRDPKHALAVTALFFMTGLAIIMYLNQPDPQPRERDYSYVGSFFAFAFWIGLGYAGVIELLKDLFRKKSDEKSGFGTTMMAVTFVVLLLAVPMQMLAKNFHSHDRSGNYVAWDYSYNMLMSCEPDAILFTNGDNDTFPLWYLQEVENIRTDIRIVNLSLLNTDWYIKQLRDMEPKVPLVMSDAELSRVGLRPWKKQKVTLKVPAKVAETAHAEFQDAFKFSNIEIPEQISIEINPTMDTPYGPVIRTQDYMILNIIATNQWQRPVYFGVTVPQSNMLSELADYMRMEGLVLRLVPYKNWDMSPTHIRKNLLEIYKYRGLNDPDVYYDENITSLLQNYRTGFMQLAEYDARFANDKEALKEVLTAMEEKIPSEVIPWSSRFMRLYGDAFRVVADSSYTETILNDASRVNDLQTIGEHLLRLRKLNPAIALLEKDYEKNPLNPKTLGLLINAYDMNGEKEKAVAPLENWLKANPGDNNAKNILESIKSKNRM
ncbi:MAG: DUF2723 domain-containing protein [Calditrichaceae bacterium]